MAESAWTKPVDGCGTAPYSWNFGWLDCQHKHMSGGQRTPKTLSGAVLYLTSWRDNTLRGSRLNSLLLPTRFVRLRVSRSDPLYD